MRSNSLSLSFATQWGLEENDVFLSWEIHASLRSLSLLVGRHVEEIPCYVISALSMRSHSSARYGYNHNCHHRHHRHHRHRHYHHVTLLQLNWSCLKRFNFLKVVNCFTLFHIVSHCFTLFHIVSHEFFNSTLI